MITDYASLQAAVIDWTHRDDLAARLPLFIQLAEKEIFRDLLLRLTEVAATGTTSGETIPLPAAMASLLRVEVSAYGRRFTLDYTSPNGVEGLTVSPDVPSRYTVENGAIRLLPAPPGPLAYSVFYLPLLTALSDSNTTNWLVLNAPDVYLHGTAKQLATWAEDAEMFAKETPLLQAALDSVQGFNERQRLPASGGLQIKPRRVR